MREYMKISQGSVQKIKTYVGFAFKAGKCVLGVDNIIKVSKPMLVIYSSDLSSNSVKKMLLSVNEHDQKVVEIENFNEITPREGCKALGIRDKSLCGAIIEQLNI